MANNKIQNGIPRRRFLLSGAATLLTGASGLGWAEAAAISKEPKATMRDWDTVLETHPAKAVLTRLYPATPGSPLPVTPTGRTRRDYLPVIAGIVDFFKQHQNEAGAIIDPYEKRERQYSTPAFAVGAALLIGEAKRADLKEPAVRAFDFALAALGNRTTADNHPDFYIPLLVHAHRLLVAHAGPTAEQRDRWAGAFRALVPERTYKDVTGGGNWNIVNLAGECLRRKDGLVAPDQREAQAAYLERCLDRQRARMTPFGMYFDPNGPLAYDAFPRLWLEDALADGSYDGAHRDELETWLAKGSLSTLLLLSPIGEWASGGRSAYHQWNEAEVAVICECSALRWKRAGRPDLAGACKRAARLALGSIQRWRRPSGELWIVKNHADPAERHGYEGYSFHSQYNLLAGGMLALAYLRADDSIAEQPTPTERGGYVFDLRESFHKVCAVGGGVYLLLDTSADAHYNASGLLRLHRAGVTAPLLSDNGARERSFGPRAATDKASLTTGVTWKAPEGVPHGVADARGAATLTVRTETPENVVFGVGYTVEGTANAVTEVYTLGNGQVTVGVIAPPPHTGLSATLPLLISDGAQDTQVTLEKASARITHGDGSLTWEILSPTPTGPIRQEGPRLATHNGYVQAAVADLPPGTVEVTYRLSLDRK